MSSLILKTMLIRLSGYPVLIILNSAFSKITKCKGNVANATKAGRASTVTRLSATRIGLPTRGVVVSTGFVSVQTPASVRMAGPVISAIWAYALLALTDGVLAQMSVTATMDGRALIVP